MGRSQKLFRRLVNNYVEMNGAAICVCVCVGGMGGIWPSPDRRPRRACWEGSTRSRWTGQPRQVSSQSAWLHMGTRRLEPCAHRGQEQLHYNNIHVANTRGAVFGFFYVGGRKMEANGLLRIVPNVLVFNDPRQRFSSRSAYFSKTWRRKTAKAI